MKTYVTREQFHQLECWMRVSGEKDPAAQLNAINIYPSGAGCDRDRLDFQGVRSMAAELGEHIALRFSTKDDVLDRFPWLCPEDAEKVAYRTAKNFDYEFIGERLESTMIHVGHPIDPPPGWFEWTNEHGDTAFTTWLDEDAAAAKQKGWALGGLEENDPHIVPGNPDLSEWALTWVWVKTLAAKWPYRINQDTRSAAKAVAAIAWAKENQPA